MLRSLTASFAFLALTGAALAGELYATQVTKLTVEERAGVARADEPVTMGLPLPRGTVTDARFLYLTGPGGKEVPCQFTETARWLDGKSIKWVLLNFRASVPARGKVVYALMHCRQEQKTPKPGVTAKLAAGAVTVDTGFVKFTVRGAKFNGFSAAWFDAGGKGKYSAANQVIAADEKSGCISAAGGKDYLSALDEAGKVSIERQGPLEAVVKAEGSHKNAAGERVLDYIVRFHAYANSPVVRVSHTFVNRQGTKAADHFPVEVLEFAVPTRLGGPGGAVGLEGGKAAAGAELKALQRTSDDLQVTADGKASAGKGKSTKPLSTGWIGAAKGGLGLAAGIRWFWQMHPKGLSVDKSGKMTLSLIPREKLRSGDAEKDKHIQQPFDVYMGQSRTHYVTFLFHKGLAPARLAEFFTGTQLPLMAWAPRKYYCRDTACIGYIAESEESLFTEEQWKLVQSYDKKLLDSLVGINRKIDGHTYTHYSDSYGLYAWGDVFHWGWKARDKSPKDTYEWGLSWAGNYYEFPNACLVQFLRTGDWRYWDRFVPHAAHVGDVFTVHYHPNKALWGACRYCPPRNHVSTDDGAPYVSSRFNHHKSQCLFSLYYLTGDLHALDNCRLVANNAVNYTGADRASQARGPGAQVIALWQVYEMWPTEKHLERLKGMARKTAGRLGRGDKRLKSTWMWGIAFEGAIYYLWAAPDDKETFDQIKAGVDKLGGKADDYSNMTLANAYVYALTGEEKYAKLAWKALTKGKTKNRPKTFGLQWRNTGFALYFMSKACPAGKFKPAR